MASAVQVLVNSAEASRLTLMTVVVFMGLFAFVFACGLLFVYDPKRTGPMLAALAIQIPAVSSPAIVYQLAAGLGVFINYGGLDKGNTIGFRFSWFFGYGWKASLLGNEPFMFGVNVVALTIFLLVWWTLHPGNQLAPTSDPSKLER